MITNQELRDALTIDKIQEWAESKPEQGNIITPFDNGMPLNRTCLVARYINDIFDDRLGEDEWSVVYQFNAYITNPVSTVVIASIPYEIQILVSTFDNTYYTYDTLDRRAILNMIREAREGL